MLFKRNFLKLSENERIAYEKCERQLRIDGWNMALLDHPRLKLMNDYPAIIFFLSLFPNNRIVSEFYDGELTNKNYHNIHSDFIALINNRDTNERNILNFINNQRGYFIISSIVLDYTNWGHHDLYVFREFDLGNEYVVDYLIVGKNSEGYHFMLVELEAVYGNAVIKDGRPGNAMRKGLNQVNDWKIWLESNFSYFGQTFKKYLNDKYELPEEFIRLDSTRISYAVICGRRNDYNNKTYRVRRESISNRVAILHYDNLIDLSTRLIKYHNFGGNCFITREGISEEYTGEE